MDFPSNSNKGKEEAKSPPKKKVVEKVVSVPPVPQKKSFGAKFKDVFVDGEAKSAARYIGAEVLLPALRNLVVEATTKGIERMIYGEDAPRRSSSHSNGPRVQYNSPVNRNFESRYSRTRSSNRYATPRYDVADLIFPSREDAESVLDQMQNIIESYDMVSVADMHELAGLQSAHTDNKWGWTNLSGTAVKQVRDGFLIDFPRVESI